MRPGEMAREKKVKTLLDTDGPVLEAGMEAKPTVVKPNQAEAERLLSDASPLVRGAAVWALEQLLSAQEFSALKQQAAESDASVLAEWTATSS